MASPRILRLRKSPHYQVLSQADRDYTETVIDYQEISLRFALGCLEAAYNQLETKEVRENLSHMILAIADGREETDDDAGLD